MLIFKMSNCFKYIYKLTELKRQLLSLYRVLICSISRKMSQQEYGCDLDNYLWHLKRKNNYHRLLSPTLAWNLKLFVKQLWDSLFAITDVVCLDPRYIHLFFHIVTWDLTSHPNALGCTFLTIIVTEMWDYTCLALLS